MCTIRLVTLHLLPTPIPADSWLTFMHSASTFRDHMKWDTQHFSFCIWMSSHGIMPSAFTHVVSNILASLSSVLSYALTRVYTSCLLYLFLHGWSLHLFPCLCCCIRFCQEYRCTDITKKKITFSATEPDEAYPISLFLVNLVIFWESYVLLFLTAKPTSPT